MRPPWRATIYLHVVRPMPSPWRSFGFRRRNGSKTWSRYAGSTPVPLSATENSQWFGSFFDDTRTAGGTWSRWYKIAFLTRCSIKRAIRVGWHRSFGRASLVTTARACSISGVSFWRTARKMASMLASSISSSSLLRSSAYWATDATISSRREAPRRIRSVDGDIRGELSGPSSSINNSTPVRMDRTGSFS